MGGCRRPRDPGCARRSKKKVCLFASLVLPRPEAANLKSCPGWGAGDRAPRDSPSFPAGPLLQRQAWEGGQGGQPLCPALRWAPPTGAGRGAAREDTRLGRAAVGAGGTPVPRRLSRQPSIWRGCPLHAYCAHAGGPPRAGGAPEPRAPPRPRPSLPGPRPLFPRAGAPGHIRLCACKLCFRNRRWGASLVGNRVFSLPLPSVTCRRLFLRGAGSPRFVCQQ